MKILTIFALASTMLLSACVESTSASSNPNPRQTTLLCDFAGQIETHTVNSGAVDVYYDYGYIKINYTDRNVYYPSHACKVTSFK